MRLEFYPDSSEGLHEKSHGYTAYVSEILHYTPFRSG